MKEEMREAVQQLIHRLKTHTYSAHDLDLAEQIVDWHKRNNTPPVNWPDRLRAAADALDAIDWAGTAYDLRDVASQLTSGDPKSDDGAEEAAAAFGRAMLGEAP